MLKDKIKLAFALKLYTRFLFSMS